MIVKELIALLEKLPADMDCGLIYDGTNPYAFDFHHRNPAEKKFLPASKLFSWDKCKPELDKCDLLCAICHRKTHFEE